MFSERSGVINIALEGIMAIGGLAGVFVLALCGDSLPSGVLVAVSILASAVAGILYSLLLGFSAITLKADQTIGGTALNMLATAVAIVAVKAFNNSSAAGNGAASAKLSYSNKAFIYKIGPLTINIFLIIGIIPMVPGGGIYYTMEALLNGNMQQFVSQGIKTAASAGAIAVGCSLVSSIVRMVRK